MKNTAEVHAICAQACRDVMRRYALSWRELRAAGLRRRAAFNLREAKAARDRAIAYERFGGLMPNERREAA